MKKLTTRGKVALLLALLVVISLVCGIVQVISSIPKLDESLAGREVKVVYSELNVHVNSSVSSKTIGTLNAGDKALLTGRKVAGTFSDYVWYEIILYSSDNDTQITAWVASVGVK